VVSRTDNTNWTEEDLGREIIRLNGTLLALVLGLMTGLLIFIATNWLVIKGGESIGPHLALLGQFFPGYSVSFLGSLAGLAYGTTLGSVAGWTVARVYNWLAFRSH